jgi:hypothetical protein
MDIREVATLSNTMSFSTASTFSTFASFSPISDFSGFPGFPGFLAIPTFQDSGDILGSSICSSRPRFYAENLSLQTKKFDIDEEIKYMIKKLQYIETPEYKAITDKNTIDNDRRNYTMIFKELLQSKSTQNY